MSVIHYLSEVDKIKAFRAYRPILSDLTRDQLEIVLLMIINGIDLEYAFDCIMGTKK